MKHCRTSSQGTIQGGAVSQVTGKNFYGQPGEISPITILADQRSHAVAGFYELAKNRRSDKTCGSGDQGFHDLSPFESAGKVMLPLGVAVTITGGGRTEQGALGMKDDPVQSGLGDPRISPQMNESQELKRTPG